MTHLSGRDLAWLQHGLRLFDNPEQMARLVKRFALKQGPKNWVWKYGWGPVEDVIYSLWSAEGVRNPLRRRTFQRHPREGKPQNVGL